MNNCKISVVIPTYKPKEYLWECLLSLTNQTLPKTEYEVVLVLNGCCEPYNTQIKSFLCKYPDVAWKYVQTDIPGVSNARNIGIDNSRGDYITFIDDDDYVSADYLRGLYSVSKKDVVGLAYPKAFDNKGWREYSIENTYHKIRNLGVIPFYQARKYFQGPCMKLIHRDIIGKRRFDIKLKNGEDALFMFLVSNNFKYVTATSDDSTYYRRVREDGAAYGKKSRLYLIKNSMRLIVKYCSIYLGSPLSYSFSFFITRIIGAVRMCLN